ncbi:MAG: hypothetical protein ABI624_06475 [Casimicrobiaceae bacterium]
MGEMHVQSLKLAGCVTHHGADGATRAPGQFGSTLRGVVGLLLLAHIVVAQGAQGAGVTGKASAQGDGDLATAYLAIEQSYEVEDWAAVRSKAVAMVAEYGDVPFLRERAGQIVSMVSECDFRQDYRPPKMAGLLAGKVKDFNANTRKLVVSYMKDTLPQAGAKEPLALADFTSEGASQVCTIRFAGPYEVEIRGTLPNRSDMGRAPDITVCKGADESVRFSFTWPTTQGPGRVFEDWTLGAVFTSKEGVEEKLDEDNTVGHKFNMMYGKVYKLRVEVNKADVVATINAIKFLAADRPSGAYGTLAFSSCPNVLEVTIKGEVDAEWMRETFDAHLSVAREAWKAGRAAPPGLPAWLLDAAR